jgi:hypothetical protein
MSTVIEGEKVGTSQDIWPSLVTADRSDAYSSGAVQALVRMAKDGRDLLFDSHSYAKHEAALLVDGWEVVEDIREAVLNPPKTAFDTSEN